METPFVRHAPGDSTPCRPWFYVTDEGWSVIRVMPMHTIQIMSRGRGSQELITILINVCMTAIILNRIMGRPDFHGVPKFRGF